MTTRVGRVGGVSVAALLVLVGASACGGSGGEPMSQKPSASGKPAAAAAEEACVHELDTALGKIASAYSATDFFRVSDEGRTVSVNGPVEGDSGALLDLQAVTCVLHELKAPEAIQEKMLQTRALDGRQSDTWSKYQVSWSYHPDNGFEAIIETKPRS